MERMMHLWMILVLLFCRMTTTTLAQNVTTTTYVNATVTAYNTTEGSAEFTTQEMTNATTTTTAVASVTIVTTATNNVTAPTAETIAINGNTTVAANISISTPSGGNATVLNTTTPSTNVTNDGNTSTTTTPAQNTSTVVTVANNNTSLNTTIAEGSATEMPDNETTLETTTETAEEISTNTTVIETTSGSQTIATPSLTIVEKIKAKWNETVAKLNFTKTSLNETQIRDLTADGALDIIASLTKALNESELKVLIQDNNITDIVELILDEKPDFLEENVTNVFNENQTLNLHLMFVGLYWFHDQVLCNDTYFQSLAEMYAPVEDSNQTVTNETVPTTDGFVQFIFDEPTPEFLLEIACDVATKEGVPQRICPTTPPPTTATPLPGPEKFEETWKDLVDQTNFSFLNEIQTEELKSVTPDNMTDALVAYVKSMSPASVQQLVDANITTQVGAVLRGNGNTAAAVLGQEIVDELGDTVKEDIFYIYMNFMDNFLSDPEKFKSLLQSYVGTSARRRKRSNQCNTNGISAEGIVCFTIETKAQDVTVLLSSVCIQLQNCDATTTEAAMITTTTERKAEPQVTTEAEIETTPPNSTPIGLTTLEIVGIAVGCFFGFILIVLIAFLIWRCCCVKGKVGPGHDDDSQNDGSSHSHHSPIQTNREAFGQGSVAALPPSLNGSSFS